MYGEPFVSKILIDRSMHAIDRHAVDPPNRSIDAHIPVRMRISSVFLNMCKLINNVYYYRIDSSHNVEVLKNIHKDMPEHSLESVRGAQILHIIY